jgi:hypothetical protein
MNNPTHNSNSGFDRDYEAYIARLEAAHWANDDAMRDEREIEDFIADNNYHPDGRGTSASDGGSQTAFVQDGFWLESHQQLRR